MAKITALIKNDIKNIKKDYLLIVLLLYPWVAVLIARFAVPPLRNHFLSPAFDLAGYYYLIIVSLVILTPNIFGIMQAFTILDERDDRILDAIRVTPLPLSGYFLYKMSFSVIFSIITVLIAVPLSGLVKVSTGHLFLVACMASLGAPMSALLINAFANNKVEGFAVAKASGFLLLLPLVAFFLPANIELLAGIIPGYWPAKAFARLVNPSYAVLPLPVYLATGSLYTVFLIIALFKRFTNKISP